jgi:hypothetical protein
MNVKPAWKWKWFTWPLVVQQRVVYECPSGEEGMKPG